MSMMATYIGWQATLWVASHCLVGHVKIIIPLAGCLSCLKYKDLILNAIDCLRRLVLVHVPFEEIRVLISSCKFGNLASGRLLVRI
jgi:hypothetical protein